VVENGRLLRLTRTIKPSESESELYAVMSSYLHDMSLDNKYATSRRMNSKSVLPLLQTCRQTYVPYSPS
jgi:hypothetical protein